MEETIYYIELFDIYEKLLTDKQRDYFKDYYFENLTLDEIAENDGISKNAVSKQLKVTRDLLIDYEKKLQIDLFKHNIKDEFKTDELTLQRIEKFYSKN